ncbi:MAG: hypothetical protein QGF67_13870 [Lentisphaeria bacterium]|nr:hypothetical protein [Lentisphaeria bacterium]MDP7742525.1 hypothetical protein [Lentisphaeria bacterium]
MTRKLSPAMLLLFCCTVLHSTPVFHVSFDRSLKADIAGGRKKPSVSGNPARVAGVSGTAIRIGAVDEYLVYPIKGNIDPAKGTISLWVKPIGFAPSDTKDAHSEAFDLFRLTPRSGGDEIRLMISRSNLTDNQRCYLYIQTAPVQSDGVGGGGDRIRAWGRLTAHPGKVVVPWEADDFKHVAATWDFDDGRLAVYLDGKLLKATTDQELKKKFNPDLPDNFQVGPYKGILWQAADRETDPKRLVLDELKIFDRALAADEIAALAGVDVEE